MSLLAEQLRLSALRAEATRFQRFARDAPIGILFLSGDGSARFANDEYLRILGESRADFDAGRFRPVAGRAPGWLRRDLGPRYETEYTRPDGSLVPILVGLSAQEDGLAAFLIDLTVEKAERRARQESEDRYRETAEKLSDAHRRKEEFFGILSHELRNPLAAIRNALHLMAMSPHDGPRALRARGVMERQIGHLSRLVDDLLDVNRIAHGRVQLHRTGLDLTRLVSETVEDHRAEFDAAGLALVLHAPGTPLPVEGDRTRLAQVLGNVLSNAAKFTPSGTVTVSLEEDAGTARLEVIDTGEGVDPEMLPRLFEPFSQADRTLARSRGGLGLGLALVKGLIHLHGGEVTMSSAGPGTGTRVVVRLRLASGPAREPSSPRAPPSPGDAAARPIANVLVIEDNADAAETLREALELEGLSVTLATDGAIGMAEARRTSPDLVICDIGLPGDLDGYGVARAMRADPVLQDTPLIALTGYAGPEDRARAKEAGFDRHLSKPSSIEELMHVIGDAARRAPDDV
jgi:two-component system CheB/CheR fusion protein